MDVLPQRASHPASPGQHPCRGLLPPSTHGPGLRVPPRGPSQEELPRGDPPSEASSGKPGDPVAGVSVFPLNTKGKRTWSERLRQGCGRDALMIASPFANCHFSIYFKHQLHFPRLTGGSSPGPLTLITSFQAAAAAPARSCTAGGWVHVSPRVATLSRQRRRRAGARSCRALQRAGGDRSPDPPAV